MKKYYEYKKAREKSLQNGAKLDKLMRELKLYNVPQNEWPSSVVKLNNDLLLLDNNIRRLKLEILDIMGGKIIKLSEDKYIVPILSAYFERTIVEYGINRNVRDD